LGPFLNHRIRLTDLVTGLMWEKKSGEVGLHWFQQWYGFDGDGSQETIWDWLDDINAEGGTGFADYSDWRIPSVKELQTIVDYAGDEPAVDPAFNNGCVADCTVLTCSCTRSFLYRSSTTLADGPSFSWNVDFATGRVLAENKTSSRHVRGGL
jgi:hypothetical protein